MDSAAAAAPRGFCYYEDGLAAASTTRDVDLSLCTQNGLISSLIAAAFLVFAAARFARLAGKPALPDNRSPWVRRLKLVLPPAVLAIALALLVAHTARVAAFTDVSLFALVATVSLAVAWTLHLIEHARNRAPSGVLCLFYAAQVLTLAWRMRAVFEEGRGVDEVERGLYPALLAGYLVLVLLECASVRPADPTTTEYDPNASPQWLAHIFSRMTFTWVWPMIRLGASKYLTMDDLYTLAPHHTAIGNYDRFMANFTAARRRNSRHPLFRALARTYGMSLVLVIVGLLVVQVFNFCVPLLVEQLIAYVGRYNAGLADKSTGVFIAFGFLFLSIASSVLYNATFFLCFVSEMVVRASLMTAVYRKSLRIPSHQRDSTGALVNHMQVDAFAIGRVFFDLPNTLIVPVQIVSYLALLYLRIGVSAIVSFALVLGAAVVMSWAAKKTLKWSTKRLEAMDERIRLSSEAIKGIRALKLNGWTGFFEAKISAIRDRELASLRQVNAMQSFQAAFSVLIPSLLALATFALSSVFSDTPMTPATVFSVLSILSMLANPLNALIWGFSPLMSALAGYKRLAKFFDHVEMDFDAVTVRPRDDGKGVAIRIQDGYFYWENREAAVAAADHAAATADGSAPRESSKAKADREAASALARASVPRDLETCTLKDINLTIHHGELVCIVAAVGHGKSSLVAAMLNEIWKARGTVERFGSAAFVPQKAAITNCSLRQNILFGLPFVEERYRQVVRACALEPDFKVMAKGDATVIGERGVNCSGGQQARISCARAVYSDSDTFIFDDCLAAVDPHVARHMFDNILGPDGVLAGKTRILITHAVEHLKRVDRIILLDNGRIVEEGSYDDLMARGEAGAPVFARLVAAHNSKRRNGAVAEAAEVDGEVSGSNTDDDDDLTVGTVDSAAANVVHPAAPAARATLAPLRVFNDRDAYGDVEKEQFSAADESKETLLGSGTTGKAKETAVSRKKRGSDASESSTTLTADGDGDGDGDRDAEHDEHMERGRVSWSVYASYIQFCGAWAFVINGGLSALCIGLTLGNQYILGAWSNSMAVDPSPANSWKWLGIFSGSVVANTVLTGVSFYFFFAVIAIQCSRNTSFALLQRCLKLPMAFFDTTSAGQVLNRFSKDQAALDEQMSPQVHHFVFSLLQLSAIMIAIAVATPLFLALLVPLALIFYRVQLLFRASSRELQRLSSVHRSPIFQAFSETLEILPTIRAYDQADRFTRALDNKLDTANRPQYTQLSVNRWLGLLLQLISAMVLFGAALFAALAPERGTTVIGVSITFAQQMTWMLIMIVRVYADIESNMTSLERIKEYSELPPEALETTAITPPPAWPENGTIEFNHYATRYREGLDLVLRDVSVKFNGGEKVAIVGRTGAGKSSLTATLFRLMEAASGTITIDGLDIATLGLHDLRTRLTILPQEPFLFSGTVRSNLDPLASRSDAEIWAALDAAHLRDAIAALPGALDAPIKASTLSVGQSQLLCLARAILRKTRVLCLDEASANIDQSTDELVQNTIRREFAHSTVIAIAHRIGTIIDYDKIMVLDRGQIVEFDSPAVLLSRPDSAFYSLAKESGLVN
ncbi:hypothetical protein H9P43_008318 [Blastocladiella emersonii ATCC 22665]|nr:hypothetical protein H9P43_008318 [Blastocladiella emersonii ATCC 22665]